MDDTRIWRYYCVTLLHNIFRVWRRINVWSSLILKTSSIPLDPHCSGAWLSKLIMEQWIENDTLSCEDISWNVFEHILSPNVYWAFSCQNAANQGTFFVIFTKVLFGCYIKNIEKFTPLMLIFTPLFGGGQRYWRH